MIICPKCKKECPDGSIVCPYCLKKLGKRKLLPVILIILGVLLLAGAVCFLLFL